MARIQGHPYFALARQRPFAAFWVAQAVSLCGDRLNLMALAIMVYGGTGSPLAVAAVMAAGTAPNVLVGPFAGALVDRLPRKTALVGPDLARAGLVLLVPVALVVHPVLVMALVFLMGCASAVFLPAKMAAVADLVPPASLDAANGAVATADALADVIGYPIAGLIVVVLGPAVGAAFLLDSVSYLLSAALLVRLYYGETVSRGIALSATGLWSEVREGIAFWAGDPPLRENTLLTLPAWIVNGAVVALIVVYAHDLSGWLLSYPANYSVLQTATGVGALAGGVVAGVLSGHLGWRVLTTFGGMAAAVVVMGLAPNILVAIAAIAAICFFGVIWQVATQTLFLLRTPKPLIGRVLSVRRTILQVTFIIATLIAGLTAETFGAASVIAVTGLIALGGTAVGLLRPALRDPERFPLAQPHQP